MNQLYLPESYIQEQYAWLRHNGYEHLIPGSVRDQVHILRSREDIEQFDQIKGRAAKPVRHLILYGPDGRTPVLIPGAGVTEAAELQEIALAVWEKHERAVGRGQDVIDTEAIRAEAGMVPKDRFHEALGNAVDERVAHHRRHRRTDPGPVIDQPKGNQHAVS